MEEITVGVEYQWKPVVCAIYNRFGHEAFKCGGVKQVWKQVHKSVKDNTSRNFQSE